MQTARIFTEFYYKILVNVIKLLVNLIRDIAYSSFNLGLFFKRQIIDAQFA